MSPGAARVASLVMHARSMTSDATEAAALLVSAAGAIVTETVPAEHVGTALGALIDPWLTRPEADPTH